MKKYKFVILILIPLIAVIYSCKRDHSSYGPQDCASETVSYVAGNDFTLNVTSPATIDFTTSAMLRVQAKLSESSPWRITIRGLKSHAVKTINGVSAVIDTTWYGRPMGNVLFTNEEVSVTLDIRCREDLSRTGNVNIIMGNYDNDPNLVLVSNFDSDTNSIKSNFLLDRVNDSIYGNITGRRYFHPSAFTRDICFGTNSPQGGGSMIFRGDTAISGGGDKNICGVYEIYPPPTFFSKIPTGTGPGDLWFNFYAHSSNSPIKVTVAFLVTNPGGSKKLGKVSYSIDTLGWKMYSINLAELSKDPGDLTTFDVSQIEYFTITVAQVNAIAPSYFNIDMMTFTRRESFLGEQLVDVR